jgi:predicted Rossmann fold flavoprotein
MVLLASGSPAAPQLGGSESGLELASSLGHELIPAHPSLVQLVSDEQWVKRASGVKIPGIAKLYANGSYVTERQGDLLFTNYGISGLAILDISREASLHLAESAWCELHLDLFPQMRKEKLTQFLLGRIRKESAMPLSLWLQGILNEKLVPVVLEQSGAVVKTEGELNRKSIGKLVYALKSLKLSVSDTRGFKGAEVATGGVDTHEVDAETMESRKVKGLYLAGEILDVDGDRGGFNFHFAWVSGMRAAKAIVS